MLAACASLVLTTAAIAAWFAGLWPATPATLAAAIAAVLAGPLLGLVHERSVSPAGTPAAAPPPTAEPALLTARLAAAKALYDWRERENAAITQRDRERLFLANMRPRS